MLLFREEAAAYVYDPSQRDSRRGLKRTWKSAADPSTGEGVSSGSSSKISSKDKGKVCTPDFGTDKIFIDIKIQNSECTFSRIYLNVQNGFKHHFTET